MIKDLNINGLLEKVSLKDKTTMKTGGKADYYVKVETVKELKNAVIKARKAQVDHIILGGGSNIIFSDKGYKGLVIDNKSNGINIRETQVESDSGVYASKLVRALAEQGKSGLEFLSGIPATVGGLIVNNGGALGWQMSDVFTSCLILDDDNKEKILYKEDLQFDYRFSVLKGKTEGTSYPVVLKGSFTLKPSAHDHVLRKIDDIRKIRAKKNPQGYSSGCIFKNPKIDEKDLPDSWKKQVDSKGRISAGFLLDMAEVKGMRVGKAYVSQEHANFIINRRNARASDIKELSEKMKKLVKEKYGISLEREVEFIGSDS
jgi:UDP-N-acetylmuramate dehydrogenase